MTFLTLALGTQNYKNENRQNHWMRIVHRWKEGGWGEGLGVVDSLYRDYPLDGEGRGGGVLELWRD